MLEALHLQLGSAELFALQMGLQYKHCPDLSDQSRTTHGMTQPKRVHT
jgi:hypothetical protein